MPVKLHVNDVSLSFGGIKTSISKSRPERFSP